MSRGLARATRKRGSAAEILDSPRSGVICSLTRYGGVAAQDVAVELLKKPRVAGQRAIEIGGSRGSGG
jgi:hypothetical protein